jgi:Tol biopolymer transport system component
MHSVTAAVWTGWILTGIAAAQTTERISVTSSGQEANGMSEEGSISSNGRYVVFASRATNLAAQDTLGVRHIYRHDRETGQTEHVSVAISGLANGDSLDGSVSASGRYVAFSSLASNLVANDSNGWSDVFVRDMISGVTTRVSVDSNGIEGNSTSDEPAISADGRHVAFISWAEIAPDDTNSREDIYVHDLPTGQTTRVSVTSSGEQVLVRSFAPSISADGRYVSFSSIAAFMGPNDTNDVADVFVHDRVSGETNRVSVSSVGGQSNGASTDSWISATGRYVAISTAASNLVQSNGSLQKIVVHDRSTGQTTLASVGSGGQGANGPCFYPCLSDDGRFVSFRTNASNVVLNDTNGAVDAFVHDRLLGQTVRVSVDTGGAQGDGVPAENTWKSGAAWISGDGRTVAFPTAAPNLVPGDANGVADVFVRELGAGPIGRFCFGDWSVAACPCDNNGAPEHGCANSFFADGGLLDGHGAPALASDTVTLVAENLSGNVCVFFQGTEPMEPAVIDDGVGCVGGAIIRLGTKAVTAATSSYPQAGDVPISVKGAIAAPGGTRVYQAFYRNAAPSFCPPATTNRTNGVAIFWTP